MERQSRTSRRQGRRLTAQFLVIAVIATMLLTALPFSNQASAESGQLNEADAATTETVDTAQTADPAEQPEVIDETAPDEGTPPADGTDPSDQSDQSDQQNLTQQNDETDTATDDLVVPPTGTSSITINKHVCYGEVSGDIYEMAQSCQGADQVYTYNLYFGAGAPIAVSQTNGSLAGFSGLPTGTFFVEEVPSADTNSALVYCKIDDYLGNPVQELMHFEDWYFSIEVNIATDGNMVFCDWFNLKDAPETYGSVIVNKILCPAGFDAYSADIYDIAANCHETPDPVTFTLTDVNGGQSSMQTAANPPFTATWDNVPAGALTIAEELPQGYGSPRVFCKNEKYTGEGDAELEVNVSGAVASTELKAGYDFLWCDWVNIPMGEVEIFINKHLCPEGFYSNDPYELAAECHEYFDPFTFSINSALTGPYASQATGDVQQGAVYFTGLFADTWTVVEDLPADYDEPVIFCKLINVYEGTETDLEMAQVFNGNAISYDLEAGYTLFCDWFNMQPGHEYGSITIIKHTCYPGYDVEAYGANPWLDCPELTNGVNFTLYHGADVPLQTMTGDSIDGGVYWGGLMDGDYQVQETFPADTWYGFVFGCVSDKNDQLAPTDLYALDGSGSIYIQLGKGENITCHWYNVPNRHGGTVVITKYWCDGDIYSVYACDLYEGGASFQIGGSQVTTGADGSVSIDLDAGSYELDEVGGTWCSAEASNTDEYGNIVVEDGETTYVSVFNCGPRETPKGKPNPGKFPNTGIGPIASEQLAA